MARRLPPAFGRLLAWRVVEPGHEHAATYAGHEYRIDWCSRVVTQARYGHGSAGWYLDLGHHEDWPYGYPLPSRVQPARLVAELRLTCPWVLPTCTGKAPSITRILTGGGDYWEAPAGVVSCRLAEPSVQRIELRQGREPDGRLVAAITPRFEMQNPATAPITVRWQVAVDGVRVDLPTWPAAFAVAAGSRAAVVPLSGGGDGDA